MKPLLIMPPSGERTRRIPAEGNTTNVLQYSTGSLENDVRDQFGQAVVLEMKK